jgi:CRP-like cAMP-binding protein
MENYPQALKKCPLFSGICESELQALLKCLSASRSVFEKNHFVFSADERATSVGVVLSGGVLILQEDFWGNRSILTRIDPGELFGEAFSCAGVEKLPVSALAAEKSEILLIDFRKVAVTCSSNCEFHSRLINNMIQILAMKNIMLTQKIEHITRKTIREKLMSYLSAQSRQSKSDSFVIPFNRQELADYLSVDRSAMSSELGRMRDEGILSFDRSSFELLDTRHRS